MPPALQSVDRKKTPRLKGSEGQKDTFGFVSYMYSPSLPLSYFPAQLLRARTFLSVSEISWVINDGWSEMGGYY